MVIQRATKLDAFHGLAYDNRKYLDNVLRRAGPFTDPDWVPGDQIIQSLESMRILVM